MGINTTQIITDVSNGDSFTIDVITGARGIQGLPGLDGAQGVQGIQGVQGEQGIQGDPGADGDDGVNGVDGAPGADGADGADGTDGAAGQGVPTGGTVGQVLEKIDGTDYNTQWVNPSGGGTWGSITGTLSAQTDLQTELDGKSDTGHTHLIADITDFTDNSTDWDAAFGWGDHASAGYASSSHTHVEADITDLQSYLTDITSESIGDLSNVSLNIPVNTGHILGFGGIRFENKTPADWGLSETGHTHTVSDITDFGSYISEVVDDTSPQLGGDLDTNGNNIQFDDAHGIYDDSGNEALIFQKITNSDVYFEMTGGVLGNRPVFSSNGTNANIDLGITAKGTGSVIFSNEVSHNNNKIVNVGNPTSAQDVMTLDYADTNYADASHTHVEADITDLNHFSPTSLLVDYSFTDNSSNWNTAHGWGDHSIQGYLTSFTETDPLFTAWDKSTGISITESQISDLSHFSGAWGDVTGKPATFTPSAHTHTESDITDLNHFTPGTLLGDYSFTDNSSDWDTAFGWGDHSTEGYHIDDDDVTLGQLSAVPTSPISNPPYSVVSDQATTNLVVNPRFEVNVTDGWNDVLTPTTSRSTAQQWTGAASLEMTTNASGEGVETDTMAVDASSNYVFSCWVKGTDGTEEVTLSIVGDNSGASNVAYLGREMDIVTTEWRRMRWFKATNGSDTTLKVQIKANSAGSQTIFIDGVQLEKKAASDGNFPSAYVDGSMGEGHSWSGTADNSSSDREAGFHVLAPINDDAVGGFTQRTDGSLEGRMVWRADYHALARWDVDEPFFPYTFTGNMQTNLNDIDGQSSGQSQGILHVQNEADGIAAYITSGVTSDYGMVLDFGSLTSGAGMAVFAPSDLSTMESSGGMFFTFADKSGAFPYSWLVESARLGTPGIANWNKSLVVYGAGGMDGVDGSTLTGTVATTNTSTAVTGSGTTFLDDYRRGDNFQYNSPGGYVDRTVESVESDTALTLTTGASHTLSGVNHRSMGRQWSPGFLRLEGGYANHTQVHGDYLYTVYPHGSTGQLHVAQGSAIETNAKDVTAAVPGEGDGDALVTKKWVDTTTRSISASSSETTVITGYTLPANMLESDKILRVTFIGELNALASTSLLTWRIKIGGTTIETSVAREVEVGDDVHFRGVIDIIGTSSTAQIYSFNVVGKRQNATSNIATNLAETGTSSIDMRLDNALEVTAQFSDASSLDMLAAYAELV